MNFNELNIIDPILRALEEEKYESPTPIQEQAIPAVLAGRDLLGCAQTGTGKTAAFGVPMLQLLYGHPAAQPGFRPIRGLILTPTRELALQIYENLRAYGRHTGLRLGIVFGGVSQNPQVESLKRGVDILVATPGRLNDLIHQKYIDLHKIEIFVLDEADRMLDMGFIHDVKKVIAQTPVKKQTLLFSATMPPEIVAMVNTLLVTPIKVAVDPVSSTVDAIHQTLYYVEKENKTALLAKLLENPNILSALVFTRTKHGADKVVRQLLKAGIQAAAIHGNKSQNARQAALSSFKEGRIRVLVATDIAARGLDIEELSHVINYDLPNIPETYVHRIGRTGRAGLSGIAISFCDELERPFLKDIQKLIGKAIPEAHTHGMTYSTEKKVIAAPAPAVKPASAARPAQPQRPAMPAKPAAAAKPTSFAKPAAPGKPAEALRAERPKSEPARPNRPAEPQHSISKHEKVPLETDGVMYSDFTRSSYSGDEPSGTRQPIKLKPFELSETPKISADLWQKRPPSRRRLEEKQGEASPAQAPVQKPQAQAQRPQALAQRPQAPAQRPQAPVQKPQAPVQKPQAPAQKPQAPARREPMLQATDRGPAPKGQPAPRRDQAAPHRPKPQEGRRPAPSGDKDRSTDNQDNSNSLMKPYWLKGKRDSR